MTDKKLNRAELHQLLANIEKTVYEKQNKPKPKPKSQEDDIRRFFEYAPGSEPF